MNKTTIANTPLKKVSLLSILLIMLFVFSVGFTSTKTSALSGSSFKPGRIMDDTIFYRSGTISKDSIQNFLKAKLPVCDTYGKKMYNSTQTRAQWAKANGKPLPPYTCLKDYTQTIPSVTNGGSDLCTGSIVGGAKSSAQIIYDVSKACNINAKVLIVLLQKEQSLVTDDWPWPRQYRSATGYGCPDTAPCDSEYYGFFNQVYQAAKAFQRYKANAANYNYRANRNNTILWHPNSSCGSSTVFIENHATAGLYIYTPYRPNSAALSNLYGTGNGCSSYGNRNFWRMYNDWFGSTLINPGPDKAISGDWDGDGKNTIGLKRYDEFLLSNSNNGITNESFIYGLPTDRSFAGDWDADIRDSVGVKRGNRYYLNNNNDLHPDVTFTYGKPSDVAIVGDWDKDRRDEVGIKRGNAYYLNYANDGVPEAVFTYGKPTDTPVIGDWNGDGRDEVAIKRGKYYYLDYDRNGVADHTFSFGRDTDTALTGDWNGDGKDSVAIKRGKYYYLDYNNDGTTDEVFSYGR